MSGSWCIAQLFGVGLACTQPQGPAAVDSFCSAYSQIITSPEDASSLKPATGGVKRRTAANDLLYRCTCQPGFTHKLCPPKNPG